MPQMHFYVPDAIAKVLRARARGMGLSVSRYVASLVSRNVGQGWPEDWFEEVVGGWKGKPLRRPPQGAFEKREAL